MKKTLSISFIAVFIMVIGLFSFKNNEEKIAKINKIDGLYIYYLTEPAGDYENLGSIKSTGMVLSKQPEMLLSYWIKRAKKQYPEANGMIVSVYNMETAYAITVE
jgi:hypothetical protein